jgi:hypothetical protein
MKTKIQFSPELLNHKLSEEERTRLVTLFNLLLDFHLNKRAQTTRRKGTKEKSKHSDITLPVLFLFVTLLSLNKPTKQLKLIFMIDTIVLTLTPDMYSINDPDKFEPSAQWALQKSTYAMRGIVSKENATKQELLKGVYKPRLTLSNRFTNLGRQILLKVEVSLPKLLFGNNFNELLYKDFKSVVDKLTLILGEMGITITAANLAKAPLASVHYSKNILLTDGSTPYHFIQKIKESNIQLSLDVNQTDYRNDGHSYKWHATSFEVAFYDKIKDLEKAKTSAKRAVEKDSDLQLNLLKSFEQRHKLEVLRIEIRLNKRDKMKQLFKKLDIISDLTFKKLFKPAISKKVLLHYVNELESKRPKILNYKLANSKAVIAELVFNNPKLNPRKIFQAYGLFMALEVATPRELRALFHRFNERGWYRFMEDAKNIQIPMLQSPFKVIREQLNKFEPVAGI